MVRFLDGGLGDLFIFGLLVGEHFCVGAMDSHCDGFTDGPFVFAHCEGFPVGWEVG